MHFGKTKQNSDYHDLIRFQDNLQLERLIELVRMVSIFSLYL